MRVGGIEAGGTKFICAAGTGPDDAEYSEAIDSAGSPEYTMEKVKEFFAARRVERIGIGSFGPVDLKAGTIAHTTPKRQWRGFPIRDRIQQELGVTCPIDTDVNVAARGEHQWGAARGIDDFVYITVGTGIGGGAMVRGRLLRGLFHPEMGHLRMPPFAERGVCDFHEHCLEGYASGTAIKAFGMAHVVPALVIGLCNIVSVLSPKLIVVGGGVMSNNPELLDAIRAGIRKEIYVPMPPIEPPALDNRSGALGAIALALDLE